MGSNEHTPRKYPLRKRVKVKYYDDFDTSLDDTPTLQKRSKANSSDDKENDLTMPTDVSIEDEDIDTLSEYEKLRLKNLEENRRMMMELGLIDPEKSRPMPKPKPVKKLPKPMTTNVKQPLKRSLRLILRTPEGKELPSTFDSTIEESPGTPVVEESSRIEEEVLPMMEDGTSIEILDRLRTSLSYESSVTTVESVERLISEVQLLKFASIKKMNSSRVQSLTFHPSESKLFVCGGSSHGEVAFWNVTDGEVARFRPHKRAVNCVTADVYNPAKLFSTSHDGTVRHADINQASFNLVYQTDEKRNKCHVTWHSQVNADTILVAHGTGHVGVVDIRAKQGQAWFECHPRSVRTVHLHPTQPHYFLTSSGTGECKIWDIRKTGKKCEPLSELSTATIGKGLTSAFFSPDGTKVVSTVNDDYLRVYDTSELDKPKTSHRAIHNNHTGRWLSVFKAVWHPTSSDLIFVGSMQHPRRIQMYNSRLQVVKELMDDELGTVNSVIAIHPKLPVIVGGNSTGKGHIFTTSSLAGSLVKQDSY